MQHRRSLGDMPGSTTCRLRLRATVAGARGHGGRGYTARWLFCLSFLLRTAESGVRVGSGRGGIPHAWVPPLAPPAHHSGLRAFLRGASQSAERTGRVAAAGALRRPTFRCALSPSPADGLGPAERGAGAAVTQRGLGGRRGKVVLKMGEMAGGEEEWGDDMSSQSVYESIGGELSMWDDNGATLHDRGDSWPRAELRRQRRPATSRSSLQLGRVL